MIFERVPLNAHEPRPRPSPGGRRRQAAIFTLMATTGLLAAAGAPAKGAPATFDLEVQFVNGTKAQDNTALERDKIIPWVQKAEQQYVQKPSLKIHYTITNQRKAAGRDLSTLHFDGMSDFGKFMDENFDNVARTKTEGHLTILVGDSLCWKDLLGKEVCWGGWSHFPHDVNPFGRKKGIWLSATNGSYTLAHEMGHLFSLKHTFEPYVGLNKQCNEGFGNKNVFAPALGHCNSCGGTIVPAGTGYICRGGVSNVMDYCDAYHADPSGRLTTEGNETLNVCQQERAADQRTQYLTKDGKVDYIALAGWNGEGQCQSDAECHDDEFCTAGVLDLSRNVCKAKKALGESCTNKRQCASDRCNLARCVAADECQSDADCGAGKYCGDPLVGQRTCKAKLDDGALCTKAEQCLAGRCKTGFCSAESSANLGGACRFDDECRAGACNAAVGGATKGTCVCRSDGDCGAGRYCDGGVDFKTNVCRAKLDRGDKCGTVVSAGNDHKCKSGQCSGFPKYECQ